MIAELLITASMLLLTYAWLRQLSDFTLMLSAHFQ